MQGKRQENQGEIDSGSRHSDNLDGSLSRQEL